MRPDIKYRIKLVIIAVLSLVVADISLFLLQQYSIISWSSFIFTANSFNLIFLMIILLARSRIIKHIPS